jgi:hypothetical protein
MELSLRFLTRKSKMSLLPVEKDVSKLLFISRSAQRACRLFLDEIKARKGLSRHELSELAWGLNSGKFGFKYSRRSFYREVRRNLLSAGLVSFEARFSDDTTLELSPKSRRRKHVAMKYVPVHQPISKRAPDGLNLPRIIWIVCHRWNMEFFGDYES